MGLRRSTITAAASVSTLAAAAMLSTGAANAAINVGGGPLPAGTTPINILNINDFHGRIDSNGTGALGKNFACTILTQRAALGSNVLTLGAGDLIGASPFTSAVQDDNPTLDFLTAVGLDASSVGNHEFDKGFDDLSGRVIPRAGFSYVGANVYDKGTTDPAIEPYKLYTVGGIRVAVVGGVTSDTPSLVAGDGIATIDIGDPVAGVNRVANELKDGNEANGEAEIVIAEYHEGGPYSSTTGTLAQQLAVPVFAHLVNDTSAKVDAILQGHTHQAYIYDVQIPGAAAGETRPVLQTGNYASNLGVISLGYDPATSSVTGYNASLVPVTAYSPTCAADPQWQSAASIVDAAVAYAAPLAAQKIGSVTATISRGSTNGAEDRSQESPLSNLIAQQCVESVNATGNLTASIGIMTPGGVRAELPYGTDGTITFGQAATIMPFGNTIKTVDLTGAQFKQVLEEQWQPAGSSRPYLQLGLSKNVTYTYDPNLPQGSRITSVMVNGMPINPTMVYTVASNSFLVTQTGAAPDGFATMQQGTNYRDSGLVDQNAFMDWVQANSPITPSFAKHGVAVVPMPGQFKVGTRQQFVVSGFDMNATGAPHNAAVNSFFLKKRTGSTSTWTTTDTLVTSPIPARRGEVTVQIRANLPHLWDARKQPSGQSMLRLTFPTTGTEVKIPVTIVK